MTTESLGPTRTDSSPTYATSEDGSYTPFGAVSNSSSAMFTPSTSGYATPTTTANSIFRSPKHYGIAQESAPHSPVYPVIEPSSDYPTLTYVLNSGRDNSGRDDSSVKIWYCHLH